MVKPILRDGNFYHRRRVPAELVGVLGKTEIWEPLNAPNAKEAKQKLPAVQLAVQARLDALKSPPTPANATAPNGKAPVAVTSAGEAFYSIPEAVEHYRLECHRREFMFRAECTQAVFADEDAFWRGGIIELPSDVRRDRGIGPALAACYRGRLAGRLSHYRDAMEIADISYSQLFIREVFRECEDGLLLIECARVEIEFMESTLLRRGSITYGADLPTDEPASPVVADNPLLSVALDEWFALRKRGLSKERQDTWNVARSVLLEICGDRALSNYRKDDARELRGIFAMLPANRNKLKATRGKPVREQVAVAEADGLQPMNVKTANEYLRLVASFFEWAKDNYEAVPVNVFEGVSLEQKRESAQDLKDPFNLDHLNSIFATPLYTKRCDTDDRFWAPLIALYSGMRGNEILKLKKTDIRSEDDIPFFDVNEEPHSNPKIKRTVKTRASIRRVPVHPELVALGFLKFVARCKGERIFPNLVPDRRGKFIDAFGKWFARHLKAAGIKRPKLDFHSFRHSWVGAAENSRVPDGIILRLKGEAKTGTLAIYSDGMSNGSEGLTRIGVEELTTL